MSVYNTILVTFVVISCLQTCFAAKLVNENDTKIEEDTIVKAKSKRNYDIHRQGQVQAPRHHRFNLPPVNGFEDGPIFGQSQNRPFTRGSHGEEGSSEDPYHGIPQYRSPGPEREIEYSPYGPPQGETEYTGNPEQIKQHEADIMSTQDTVSLYYDDLMRLQSLMSNMISDPYSEPAEEPDFDPDY